MKFTVFIPTIFLPFQLFYANEGLQMIALIASGLGLISFMKLDGRKNTQSVKTAWANLIL